MAVFKSYVCESCPWQIRLNALNKLIRNEMNAQILQTLVMTQTYIWASLSSAHNDVISSGLICNKSWHQVKLLGRLLNLHN